VALAVAVEAVLEAKIHQLVLTPSLAAVVISVLYGGLTAGLVATFLSIVLMDVFFLQPGFSLQTAAVEDLLQLAIFVTVSLIVSSLSKERMARIAAEARSEAKDHLLREVAHELRTPMSSILGWTQVLRHRPDEESLRQACEVIERNAKMQMLLVNDLLDVARILTGKLFLEESKFSVNKVVCSAIGIVQPAAAAKNIRIIEDIGESGAEAMVNGDERRLLQVFWNLLTNAIKFSPEGTEIRVKSSVIDDCAVIKVIDNGPGIDPEQLRKIFEKGEQGNNAQRSEGLGLGLWLAKSIVQLHGGDLEASSVKGHGSTFSVTLPLLEKSPRSHS
jgi:signal transduction histidine kinase